MKPQPAVFTKERPCSKVEIWNCFRRRGGKWAKVPIAVAESYIGTNVPRALIAKGRAERCTDSEGSECIRLTLSGKNWLKDGTKRYLKNNPDRRQDCKNVPKDWGLK